MPDTEAIAIELLSKSGVTVGGDEPQDIEVHDDRLWGRLMHDRELGLGESYMDGWWDANRLDHFLASVQSTDLRSMVRPSPQILAHSARAARTRAR